MYCSSAFLILLLVASCSGNNSKIIKKACSGKGNKNEVELSDVCVQQLKLTNKKGVPLNGKKFMAVGYPHQYPLYVYDMLT